MFSTNFKKISCSFAENKIFENPRWRACCEAAVAIATDLI